MYNPFTLEGKTILVTGASSGIGRATAVECSKMGAKVIITARNQERLNETLLLMDNQDSHKMILADLSNDEEIDRLMKFISGKLNGIVHCAGFLISKPFQFLSRDNIKETMKVNFESPILLTQLLLKDKKIDTVASVVFISSVSGVFCSAFALSIYSASKGAINGAIKGLAIDLAVKGIRVNSVNPGMIDTNIYKSGVLSDEQIQADIKKYPLKRHGKPEEVAYGVIYLLSDASKWITGSSLVIDGGYTLL
jgi:NAD(P)-dependent dehydrogenase (short-subunit alcohol dehydrogenase family)